jgi:hypothetical protein
MKLPINIKGLLAARTVKWECLEFKAAWTPEVATEVTTEVATEVTTEVATGLERLQNVMYNRRPFSQQNEKPVSEVPPYRNRAGVAEIAGGRNSGKNRRRALWRHQ